MPRILTSAQKAGGFQSKKVQDIIKHALVHELPVVPASPWTFHARVTPKEADFWVTRLDTHLYRIYSKYLGEQFADSDRRMWSFVLKHLHEYGTNATLDSETNKLGGKGRASHTQFTQEPWQWKQGNRTPSRILPDDRSKSLQTERLYQRPTPTKKNLERLVSILTRNTAFSPRKAYPSRGGATRL